MSDDPSALAWVAEEVQKSLEQAQKSLRKAFKNSVNIEYSLDETADMQALRASVEQFHKAAGALELAALPEGARVLRASEVLLNKWVIKPHLMSEEAVKAIESLSFAVMDFIHRKISGKPVSAVALFPQYEAVMKHSGLELPRPADLWQPAIEVSFDQPLLVAMPAAEAIAPTESTLGEFESGILLLMRQGGAAEAQTLTALLAGMSLQAAERSVHREANTWALASAFMQALAQERLTLSLHTKRMLSQVLSQVRATVRHQEPPSDRLAHDLMFFCSQALPSHSDPGMAASGPLDAVRQALSLASSDAVNLSAPTLGLFDPSWVALALKRISSAKDGWSAVAGGDALRLNGLTELFVHVGDSLRRLCGNGNVLALALADAAAEVVQSGQAPGPMLAMEVATSLLYVEASWQDGSFSNPQEAERLQRLAERIDKVRDGHEPEPLDAWIETLYRRVSDLQTMGSVVKEIRVTLSDCEKQIDVYFRDPAQRAALMSVPPQLKSMKGVFSVLGVPEATHAVDVMHADVDVLLQSQDEMTTRTAQERLATNVSALGFLVDFLGVQPFAAKTLFAFNDETGLLTSRVSRLAPEVPELVPMDVFVPSEAPQDDIALPVATANEVDNTDLSGFESNIPTDTAPTPFLPASATVDTAQDAEMLDVFIEEAHEVLQEAQHASGQLLDQPDDINVFITLRRAFHTLKGSSRMVGLRDFGEGAWACEQLYNAWIASQASANADLKGLTDEALQYLGQGVGIASALGSTQGWDAFPLIDAANALRLEGRRQTVTLADLGQIIPEAQSLVAPAMDLPQDDADEFILDDFDVDFDPTGPVPFDPTGPVAFDPTDIAPFDQTSNLPVPDVSEELPEIVETDSAVATMDMATTSANDEAADEQFKLIGTLRISIPLFNIYLNEADEQSRRLCQLLSEWALEHHRTLTDEPVNLAHSLAGNSAAVGFSDLSALARLLEHALLKAQALGSGDVYAASLFVDAADEIRRLLHQFAAGFLKSPSEDLMEGLQSFERDAAQRLDAEHLTQEVDDLPLADEWVPESEPILADMVLPVIEVPPMAEVAPAHDAPASADVSVAAATPAATLGMPAFKPFAALDTPNPTSAFVPLHVRIDLGDDADIDAIDAIDPDLFSIFEEEAQELLPQLIASIRQWLDAPTDRDGMDASMRALHTFKGGARLLGAMRLGELAHRMESDVERLSSREQVVRADIEPLLARADVLQEMFDELVQQHLHGSADATQSIMAVPAQLPVALVPDSTFPPLLSEVDESLANAEPFSAGESLPGIADIDWLKMPVHAFKPSADAQSLESNSVSAFASVRVKPKLLDRLVNQAGEVSIARSRLAAQVQQMRGSVGDLTDNMARLREQLREIELQAETQLSTRMEAARSTQQEFDPLEFDRYTRFQELTRMMAESVNDVAAVQTGLVRNLESAEDHLVEQSRLTRELQDDLLRTRMVEFEGLTDRLYRVIRQASKETGKQVRLDIVGGQTEIDRGVLDRMTGAFEHLLRNCVTHGIEMPEGRLAKGKPAMGAVIIAVKQDGNEVSLEFRDDGAGLDLERIRTKALQSGLLKKETIATDAELAQLIFTPGFSTAEQVTELAGRGIGMDVVRADVTTMGGRIETSTAKGQGTSFKLMLPLTTAVTKVVMVRCGDLMTAIPTDLVELVRRVPSAEVSQAYQSGMVSYGDQVLPFFWMGALLQHSPRGSVEGKTSTLLMIRSAQQRITLHVDEVLGNQDVVVKNLGPQLSRVPGLAGMTVQASGAIALIYNPVALAAVYGVQAQNWSGDAGVAGALATTPTARSQQRHAPLVLVVDDSLTVRRVTQRLLIREGYRVVLAKDGLDALEKLSGELPVVVLSDIEMPRMNGFDLVRNLRANADWSHLPIVMITSRIAQKHRDYAMELGANHYLGKPYSEEELLSLVARYAPQETSI